MIRAQALSRGTPSTIRESVASLRAQDNAPADKIGQAQQTLSFGLADAVQSVIGRRPIDEVPNLATDVAHTLASKVFHTPCFTAIE